MLTNHSSSRNRSIPYLRLAMWFGVFTLLLSVASQIISVQSAEAQSQALLDLQGDGVQSTMVYIDKYDCPTGFDWSQASYEQLAQGCAVNQTPVNIAVNGETQSISGGGQWGPYDDLTSYDIGEEERQGYAPPQVFCGNFVPDQSQPSLNYVGVTSFFNWQIQPGESVYCQLFNYQLGGQFGTIILHKLACPDSW
ncbi:MAG: hypothetical protein AB7G88_03280, partial [Thermomicrobiales bacterium]